MSSTEKLIECIKEHEILYDMKNKNFRKVDEKNRIWKEIGDKLEMSSEDCRRRWKSLRDTYKGVKRKRMRSGGLYSGSKKWRHFDSLTFLDNFHTTTKVIDDAEESSDENDGLPSNMWNELEVSVSTTVGGADETANEKTAESPTEKKFRRNSPGGKKISSDDSVKKQFSQLLDTLQGSIRAVVAPVADSPKDSTSQLFQVLASKVSRANLTDAVKNRLELNVAKLVYDVIEENDNKLYF